jgi:uncharacterized protein with GYD domain
LGGIPSDIVRLGKLTVHSGRGHSRDHARQLSEISSVIDQSEWEDVMVRLITRGNFTQNYAKGLISAPEDREPAVRKLVEGAGGKLNSFYFTTGDTDFVLVAEANDAESLIAALLAAVASGAISNVTTSRAWTGAEFKSVAEMASKAAGNYRPPGKS